MQKIELLRKEECKFTRELPRQMRLSCFIPESCEYIFLVGLQQKLDEGGAKHYWNIRCACLSTQI